MLAAKSMLEALSVSENEQDYEYYNNDHDFSKVLEACSGDVTQKRKLRYADGQEKIFSFDD